MSAPPASERGVCRGWFLSSALQCMGSFRSCDRAVVVFAASRRSLRRRRKATPPQKPPPLLPATFTRSAAITRQVRADKSDTMAARRGRVVEVQLCAQQECLADRLTLAADVTSLLGKMKAATVVKRGEPGIKDTVEGARDEMNRFVAYYR